MAEETPLQLSISKSKTLGELSRKLRRVTDASEIDALELPSFGGEDPSGDYEEQLEAVGCKVLSWDEERVLVATPEGLKLMPLDRLHDEVCGARCPFCRHVNCLNFDHPDSGTCRHYIGSYDVVNCEFQWHERNVERLVKQEGDWPDSMSEDACEWACGILQRALGEVALRVTTDEAWVSENWSTGTPVFFAGSAALRKLKQIDRAEAGARRARAR